VVYLKDPRLELVVQENVKAEDLKAHGVLYVVGLTTAISVRQLGLDSANSFDYRCFDVMQNSG